MARFPISYSRSMRVIGGALALRPRGAWVEVDDDTVEVRMGWAFHARVPRTVITAVEPIETRPISRGVHFRPGGRWLVNGSGEGVVRLSLAPGQHARAIGFRVPLTALEVSVEDPAGLVAALSAPPRT